MFTTPFTRTAALLAAVALAVTSSASADEDLLTELGIDTTQIAAIDTEIEEVSVKADLDLLAMDIDDMSDDQLDEALSACFRGGFRGGYRHYGGWGGGFHRGGCYGGGYRYSYCRPSYCYRPCYSYCRPHYGGFHGGYGGYWGCR